MIAFVIGVVVKTSGQHFRTDVSLRLSGGTSVPITSTSISWDARGHLNIAHGMPGRHACAEVRVAQEVKVLDTGRDGRRARRRGSSSSAWSGPAASSMTPCSIGTARRTARSIRIARQPGSCAQDRAASRFRPAMRTSCPSAAGILASRATKTPCPPDIRSFNEADAFERRGPGSRKSQPVRTGRICSVQGAGKASRAAVAAGSAGPRQAVPIRRTVGQHGRPPRNPDMQRPRR